MEKQLDLSDETIEQQRSKANDHIEATLKKQGNQLEELKGLFSSAPSLDNKISKERAELRLDAQAKVDEAIKTDNRHLQERNDLGNVVKNFLGEQFDPSKYKKNFKSFIISAEKELVNQKAKIRSTHEQISSLNTELSKEKARYEEIIQGLMNQSNIIKERFDQEILSKNTAEANLVSLRQEVADLKLEINKIEFSFDESKKAHSQEKNCLEAAIEEKRKELEENQKSHRIALENLMSELSKIKQKYEETTATNDDLRNSVQKLNSDIESLKLKLDSTEKDYDDYKSSKNKEISELKTIAKKVDDELKLKEAEHIEAKQALTQQLETKRQENNDLLKQDESAKETIVALTEKVKELNLKLSEAEQNHLNFKEQTAEEISRLKSEVKKKEDDALEKAKFFEELRERNCSLEITNNKLAQEVSEKDTEVAKYFEEKQQLDTTNLNLTYQLKTKEHEIAEIKDNVHSLSDQLEKSQLQTFLIKTQFSEKTQNFDTLLTQHNNLKLDVKQREEEQNKATKEIAQLKQQNHDLETKKALHIDKTKAEFEKLNREYDTLKKDKKISDDKITELEKTIEKEKKEKEELAKEHEIQIKKLKKSSKNQEEFLLSAFQKTNNNFNALIELFTGFYKQNYLVLIENYKCMEEQLIFLEQENKQIIEQLNPEDSYIAEPECLGNLTPFKQSNSYDFSNGDSFESYPLPLNIDQSYSTPSTSDIRRRTSFTSSISPISNGNRNGKDLSRRSSSPNGSFADLIRNQSDNSPSQNGSHTESFIRSRSNSTSSTKSSGSQNSSRSSSPSSPRGHA